MRKAKCPDHYDLSIEPLEVIDSWELDFYLGNVVKYIARHKRKNRRNPVDDIDKAIHYLELYKKHVLMEKVKARPEVKKVLSPNISPKAEVPPHVEVMR